MALRRRLYGYTAVFGLLFEACPAQPRRAKHHPGLARPPHTYVYEDERTDRRPRLALCIVGLFRDHQQRVLPSLRKAVMNSSEWRTDVFIETWTTLGAARTKRLAAHTDQTGGILDPRWLSEYPNLISVHAERTPRNVSRHFHGLDLPHELVHHNPLSFGSTLPNLRRMHECNEAKKAWEDANGFTYDAVMKMRPDYVCGGSTWAAVKLAIRSVLRHHREPTKQPYPFFHEHSWPHVMVSDKFAVGTSAAMDYYMGAWNNLPRLFQRPRLADSLGKRNHLVGERLMKVHMVGAPFDHMQTFCCQSPRKHKKQGRCRQDFAPGGVMYEFLHSAGGTAEAGLNEEEEGGGDGDIGEAPEDGVALADERRIR